MSHPPPPSLPLGQLLAGRYTITGFLGAGGFAAIYEGKDRVLEREVAIKLLNLQELARTPQERADFTARFEREAKMAARINHPNVVSIHDFGDLDGQPFIVMERLRGHDMDAELKRHGPMSPERLWPLLCRSLDALDRGHVMGIIHKDLKPSNLFLTHPGTEQEDVRVLDFGIARMIGDDAALTGTGQVFGTARYLAPEYIRDKDSVSPAVDVYQMGLILTEMLSGSPAVPALHGLACVFKHSTGDLLIPSALLDSPLGPILARALALDPKDRHPTALALRKALEAIDPASIPRLAPDAPLSQLNQLSASPRGLASPSKAPDPDAQDPRSAADPDLGDARTSSELWLNAMEGPGGEADARAAALDPRGEGQGAEVDAQARPPSAAIPEGFVWIAPGRFLMGSPEEEMGRGEDEARHEVTLTRPFLIQSTPVTQAQWRAVMGDDPSHFKGDALPVENVSWFDAVAWCNARSRQEGLTEHYWLENPRGEHGRTFTCDAVLTLGDCDGYRLPTEAEWEYAARAGAAGIARGPLETVAWIGANSQETTHPVAALRPNAWGLFDALGNVWEWVSDWYAPHLSLARVDPTGPAAGSFKIARGGSFRSVVWATRLANRTRHAPTHRNIDTGLRAVRSFTPAVDGMP